MAFVKQFGKKDCGIAALAMLCEVTYELANQAIPWKRHGLLYGTDTRLIRAGAKRLGYDGLGTEKHQLRRLRGPAWFQDIPENSLVKIPGEHSWHWVVWRKGKIYDPARGVFKPEKYDHRPSAYMQFVPAFVPCL